MHYQSDGTQIASRPAPKVVSGTPGYVTPGNAVAGIVPSIDDPDLMNAIMDELCGVVVASGLALDKTNNAQLIAAIKLLRAITIPPQLLASSGTLVPPPNYFAAIIEGLGGGGGGGSGFGAPSPNVSAGTGGGSSGYFRKLYSAAQLGASASMLIGAAGTGGAPGQNTGSVGGNTVFTPSGSGPICTASGGGGGPFGITSTAIQRGGYLAGSGSASGGDIDIDGQPGSWPLLFGGSTSYQAISGSGGNSFYWPGGQSSQEEAAGNIARGYGAGGGGGAALTTSRAGGNGYQGCIIATFFCFSR